MTVPSHLLELGPNIARALGLDPDTIMNFTLRCGAGSIPTVEVEYLILDSGAIERVLKTYELVKRPDEAA